MPKTDKKVFGEMITIDVVSLDGNLDYNDLRDDLCDFLAEYKNGAIDLFSINAISGYGSLEERKEAAKKIVLCLRRHFDIKEL